MCERTLEVLEKISDTIGVVSNNLLCPSYHGMIKYNKVNAQLREMRDLVKSFKEYVNGKNNT